MGKMQPLAQGHSQLLRIVAPPTALCTATANKHKIKNLFYEAAMRFCGSNSSLLLTNNSVKRAMSAAVSFVAICVASNAWAAQNGNTFYVTGPNQNLVGSPGDDNLGFFFGGMTEAETRQILSDFTLSGTWAGGAGSDQYFVTEQSFRPEFERDASGNYVGYQGPEVHVDFDLSRIVILETGVKWESLDRLFIDSKSGKDFAGTPFNIPDGIEHTVFAGLKNIVIIGSDTRDDIQHAGPMDLSRVAEDVTIYGNGGDDNLIIGGNRNVVYGGFGNDSLNAYSNCDRDYSNCVSSITEGSTYYGGPGDDIFGVWRYIDRFVELPNEGFDIISVKINGFVLDASRFKNIEQVLLWDGEGNNNLTVYNIIGSPQADTIIGNDGNNNIVAVGGADKLSGAGGSDDITPGKGNDKVDGGTGTDTVRFSGKKSEYTVRYNKKTKTYTVSDKKKNRDGVDTIKNVETLKFADTRLRTVSSAKDGSFKQFLSEQRRKGLKSTASADPMDVTVMVRGSASRNWIYGGEGAENLKGTEVADLFYGDFGSDLIDLGDDASPDVAVYFSVQDTPVGTTRDQIVNFKSAHDRIDLSRIDADANETGKQVLTFTDTRAQKNSVWYQKTGPDIIIRGDVNGNTLPDFEILVRDVEELDVENLIR